LKSALKFEFIKYPIIYDFNFDVGCEVSLPK
jgi:hypothetical protein